MERVPGVKSALPGKIRFSGNGKTGAPFRAPAADFFGNLTVLYRAALTDQGPPQEYQCCQSDERQSGHQPKGTLIAAAAAVLQHSGDGVDQRGGQHTEIGQAQIGGIIF